MRCAAAVLLLALFGERALGRLGLRVQWPWDEEEKVADSRELSDGREAPDPPRDDIWAPTNNSTWQLTARRNTVPKRVAIAYRGDYHRRVLLSHAVEYSDDPDVENSSVAWGCSDFFHNAEQHWQNLVSPLEAAGASVKTYFHSYRDLACPQRDSRLVRELRPRRHEWSRKHLELIVDSYLRVLELVLEDEDEIDAVVLTRFDLRYREPITAFDIDWSVTNVAHREGEMSWLKQKKMSDLFYVLPIGHVQPLMEALRVSGTDPTGHKATGAGHWIWYPFTDAMGKDALRFIDQQFTPSFSSPSETPSFLGISRRCGADYDGCPAAQ
jgi:hypothetical protein